MSEQIKYWESIIASYKMSGLSQPAFCKENGLSYNQFQYRWYLHNRAKKAPSSFEEHCLASSFESVTIAHPSQRDGANHIAELSIHLPNKIRCDIKMDLRNNALSTLLRQLVTLC